jgi:hypothetical protein
MPSCRVLAITYFSTSWFTVSNMHVNSVLVALAIPALTFGAILPQDESLKINTTSSDIVNGRDITIIGGSFAAPGEFPFAVSIQQSGFHICGGTLLVGSQQ